MRNIDISYDIARVADLHLAADASRDMATPFAGAAAPQAGQPQDFGKLFKAEIDNLEFSEGLYSWVSSDVEARILKKYGREA